MVAGTKQARLPLVAQSRSPDPFSCGGFLANPPPPIGGLEPAWRSSADISSHLNIHKNQGFGFTRGGLLAGSGKDGRPCGGQLQDNGTKSRACGSLKTPCALGTFSS